MKRKIVGVMIFSAILAGAVAEIPLKSLAEKMGDKIYSVYEMTVNNSSDAVVGETIVDGGAAGGTTVEVGGATTKESDGIIHVSTIDDLQSDHDYNSYEDKM